MSPTLHRLSSWLIVAGVFVAPITCSRSAQPPSGRGSAKCDCSAALQNGIDPIECSSVATGDFDVLREPGRADLTQIVVAPAAASFALGLASAPIEHPACSMQRHGSLRHLGVRLQI